MIKRKIVEVMAVLLILTVGFTVTIEGEKGALSNPWGPVTDFTPDMNISEAAVASFLGEYSYDNLGEAVAGVGDVNGDGLDDFLISSDLNDEGGNGAGQSYLVFGKTSDWYMKMNISNADASFLGEEELDASGISVEGVGDVNGDGYDDFLIGAQYNDAGGDSSGQAYLIFGKKTGWTMDVDLANADASFIGEETLDRAGFSSAGAGDVNGDGFDDFLIGAIGNIEGGGANAGQTYLILGKASGWARDTDLSASDASFLAEASGDYSGWSIAGGGDVNGDGYDDILIGSSDNDGSFVNSGQVYVIFGKTSGWSMDTNLASSDASFTGENTDDYLGDSVSIPGDVNGDGYDDILMLASHNDELGTDFGQTYLVLGKASGWGMDTIITEADASFLGQSEGDWYGRSAMGAGDVNLDGYDDILIGDQKVDEGSLDAGQSYLIYGKANGWSMDMDLSDADASFIGEDGSDRSGYSISSAGDVNGDGSDDFLISANTDDEGGRKGQVYLLSLEGNTEPIKVFSIKVKNGLGNEVTTADIGENLEVEIAGMDRNATHRDIAKVNLTYSISGIKVTFGLRETGLNTGIYQGTIKVQQSAVYFEKLRFSSYVDQSKYRILMVDYKFRPSSVSTIGVYSTVSGTVPTDKLDLDQVGYFKCAGADTNPFTVDKSFVNLTSDKDITFRTLVIMTETGPSTGLYLGMFKVPLTMQYFENITLTSSETPSKTARFMVHTPVQIRYEKDYLTATEDSEYRVGFYNFGYNPVEWTMTTDAYWLAWDETENEVHGIPRNNDVGTDVWSVMIVADDSFGNSDDLEYSIDVTNNPPTIITSPVLECTENEEYRLDIDSDDDGQGHVQWYLTTSAPFLTLDRDDGILAGTPTEGAEGVYTVNVQVQDGNGGTDYLIFDLTVFGRNDRPTITTTDVKQVEQDTPFRRDYDVSDPDTGDSHHWTLSTDADWLSMENGTGVLYGTPNGFDVGDWLVNISVTDSGGLSDSREFTLTVIDVKDKPEFVDVPENVVLVHGTDFYFDVNGTDPDLGSVLFYSLDTEPECNMTIDAWTGEVHWKAAYRSMPPTGQGMSVTLKVSDGELFNLYKFNVKVTPTLSPTVELLSPAIGARVRSDSTGLLWRGTDPEDEPLTYTLYIADSMSNVQAKREEDIEANGITKSNFNVTGLTQGRTYYWTVIPDDGCTSGTCSNGIFSFRVNSRPILDEIADQNAEVGKELRFKLPGSDPDQDDALTYEVINGPPGLTVKAETGMLTWTPKEGQVATHPVKVKVTDGYETVERSFDIAVSENEGSNTALIVVLIVIIVALIVGFLLYLFVIKGRSEKKEKVGRKEEEESKRILEEMEEHKKLVALMEGDEKTELDESFSDVPTSVTEAHAHDHESKDDMMGSEE